MESTSSADLKEVARELAEHLDISETNNQIVSRNIFNDKLCNGLLIKPSVI